MLQQSQDSPEITAQELTSLKLNGINYSEFIGKIKKVVNGWTKAIEKKILSNDHANILSTLKCILTSAESVFISDHDPFYLMLIKYHKEDQNSLHESIYSHSQYLRLLNVSSKMRISLNEEIDENEKEKSEEIEISISPELKKFGSMAWSFFNMLGALIFGIAHPQCMRTLIKELKEAIGHAR